jgi:ABC-type multidrug transport system fused ATPase/permease subunit
VRQVNKILYREIILNFWSLFIVILLMLLIVGFDVISPWPFKILIDNVLAAQPFESGSPLAFLHNLFPSRDLLGFFAVFVYFMSTFALTLVEYIHSAFTKRVIRNLTADFSKAAFKNLQTLAIGFYSKQKIGDYIYRLGYDVSALGELIEDGLLPMLTSALYLLVTVSIMLLIDVRLTLLSIMALPFLVLGLYGFNKRVSSVTKRSEHFNSATFSFIEETLKHLKVIQAFSQEQNKSATFDRRIETTLTSDIAVFKLDFLISLLVGIVIAVSYSIVMLYGIQAVFSGTLTTGLLIVFIFYLDNLTTPILSLIYAVTVIRQTYTKISRMEEFFSTKSHLEYHRPGARRNLAGSGIRFENVTLAGAEGKKILKNISFTIEAGKRTAIFGASGAGKTTLINLIMRFVDKPSHGRILIGGVPIDEYDIKTLRDSISYVPQEITLFDDTIRNNIVFGNQHHGLDRIHRAAKRAAADFIHKLPGGYNFKVGESGGFLSGGQRQRLMLARAFMKEEAEILIFDETFSALDVKTRADVLKTVHTFSEGKTTLLISNIFDVITAAENIIVLSHGNLLYSGPAKRLPKEISLYKMIAESEPEGTEE